MLEIYDISHVWTILVAVFCKKIGIAVEDKSDRMTILQSMLIQQYAYLKKNMSTSIGLAILDGMQTFWWRYDFLEIS